MEENKKWRIRWTKNMGNEMETGDYMGAYKDRVMCGPE